MGIKGSDSAHILAELRQDAGEGGFESFIRLIVDIVEGIGFHKAMVQGSLAIELIVVSAPEDFVMLQEQLVQPFIVLAVRIGKGGQLDTPPA